MRPYDTESGRRLLIWIHRGIFMTQNSSRLRYVVATLAAVVALAVAVPVAWAAPSDDVLATAREAAEHGQATAAAMGNGPTDEDKKTGLDRAEAALERAAENRERQAQKHAEQAEQLSEKLEEDHPGNGFGRGRAAEVHAILAAGGSPSELGSHGEKVTELVRAYQAVKGEDKPGNGHGPGGNPTKGADADDEG